MEHAEIRLWQRIDEVVGHGHEMLEIGGEHLVRGLRIVHPRGQVDVRSRYRIFCRKVNSWEVAKVTT